MNLKGIQLSYPIIYNCNGLGITSMVEDCKNGYHHKSSSEIHRQVYSESPKASSYVSLLLTGFKIYRLTSSDNHVYGTKGLATIGGTRASIFYQDTDINEYRRVVLHELLHLFRARDHYDSPDLDNSINYCIWGWNRTNSSVVNNLTMCSNCVNYINSEKAEFHNHF